MSKLAVKQALYTQCGDFVNERLSRIRQTLANIQESLANETKSSAGDKHETGRAMIQLEREKAGNQLAETRKLQQALLKIDINPTSQAIRTGSLVYTSGANYFIAISAGRLKVNNELFFAIAPNTPIGQLLLGKRQGDTVVFNGNSITVQDVA